MLRPPCVNHASYVAELPFEQLSSGAWRAPSWKRPLVPAESPTTSAVVELTCARFIPTYFPSVGVRKAEGLVWAPVFTRRWWLGSCRMSSGKDMQLDG
jgi:hypothetical protein